MVPAIDDLKNMVKGTGSHNSPAGVMCHFVAINEDWGIKCYVDQEERDMCYDNQAFAYEFGLAPAVGVCFSVPYPEDMLEDMEECELENCEAMYYCYVTEKVELLLEESVWHEDRELYQRTWDETEEMRGDIEQELKEVFAENGRPLYGCLDMHPINVGFRRGDKKPICIDFGFGV